MPAQQPKDCTVRWLAAAGIAASLGDVLLVVWLGSLDPDYSYPRQYVSELLEPGRPYAGLYAAWCVVWGILFAAFAIALGRGLQGSKGAWLGPAALLVLAPAGMVVGFFPCDPGGEAHSLSGQIHLLVGGWISTIAIILAPLLSWVAMRNSEAWRSYRVATLVTGLLLAVFAGCLAVGHYGNFDRSTYPAGLLQRLLMGIFYIWVAAVAIRIACGGSPR